VCCFVFLFICLEICGRIVQKPCALFELCSQREPGDIVFDNAFVSARRHCHSFVTERRAVSRVVKKVNPNPSDITQTFSFISFNRRVSPAASEASPAASIE